MCRNWYKKHVCLFFFVTFSFFSSFANYHHWKHGHHYANLATTKQPNDKGKKVAKERYLCCMRRSEREFKEQFIRLRHKMLTIMLPILATVDIDATFLCFPNVCFMHSYWQIFDMTTWNETKICLFTVPKRLLLWKTGTTMRERK